MRMINRPAGAAVCVLLGMLAYTVSVSRALKANADRAGRRWLVSLLPAVLGLMCAKAGYELLQPGEIASVFRWCFTTGLAGLLAGTFLAAKLSGREAAPVLDRTAPALCAAAALARMSQRWLGEVGAGPWLEEGMLLRHSPFVLVNAWNETLLAIFVPEALAGLIALWITWRAGRKNDRLHHSGAEGRTAAVAVLFLTVPQIFLEQFRTGHYMHWRMVRAEQVICALAALAAVLAYRLAKGRREQSGLEGLAAPAAGFLLMCGIIAFVQFVLDGKLMELPEAVCWSLYGMAVAGMLAAGYIAVTGTQNTVGAGKVPVSGKGERE